MFPLSSRIGTKLFLPSEPVGWTKAGTDTRLELLRLPEFCSPLLLLPVLGGIPPGPAPENEEDREWAVGVPERGVPEGVECAEESACSEL